MREKEEFEKRQGGQLSAAQAWAFDSGFVHAWKIQQRKLDAYAAFVTGKITLRELEEVIK